MAYVRVGQFAAIPEHADELKCIYERDAIPVIRAAEGNVSAALLQQHASPDQFLAITIWATAADAERYDKSGQALAVVDKVRFAFAGSPTLTTYDAFGLA